MISIPRPTIHVRKFSKWRPMNRLCDRSSIGSAIPMISCGNVADPQHCRPVRPAGRPPGRPVCPSAAAVVGVAVGVHWVVPGAHQFNECCIECLRPPAARRPPQTLAAAAADMPVSHDFHCTSRRAHTAAAAAAALRFYDGGHRL